MGAAIRTAGSQCEWVPQTTPEVTLPEVTHYPEVTHPEVTHPEATS